MTDGAARTVEATGGAAQKPSFRLSDAVVVASDPASIQAESIGALRAHIIGQQMPAGHRALALCSPTAGVGCTALAVNLALALAESGVRTLLIDADLRDPGVHRLVTPSTPVPGLAQCLFEQRIDYGDVIQFDVASSLSVLFAGGRPERPQDLLASDKFRQLIELCLRDFDFTVIDTPPSSQSADARRVAAVAGHAVLVVERDRTLVSDVNVLADELRGDGAVVVGSVLTAR